MSNETKEELIRIYLQKQAARITEKVALEPEGILSKLGIKEHELRQELLRTLSNNNFSISFYAARVLIGSGNHLAREIFIAGFNGSYDPNDFSRPGLYMFSDDNTRFKVTILSAFALEELGEGKLVDYFSNILLVFKKDIIQLLASMLYNIWLNLRKREPSCRS